VEDSWNFMLDLEFWAW